jgi:Cupredoxin-like domain
MRRLGTSLSLLLATALTFAVAAAVVDAADKPAEVALTIEKQKFDPAEVKVKANAPFVLVVTNKDSKPAEVENKDLKVEKVVAPGKTVSIRVRALKPGSYVFVDDFNKSAQVKIVAE